MSRIYSHSSTPVPVRGEQDEDGSATALQKILLTRSSVVLKLRKIQHMVRSLSVSTWIRRKNAREAYRYSIRSFGVMLVEDSNLMRW